jgi:hypothetical protein
MSLGIVDYKPERGTDYHIKEVIAKHNIKRINCYDFGIESVSTISENFPTITIINYTPDYDIYGVSAIVELNSRFVNDSDVINIFNVKFDGFYNLRDRIIEERKFRNIIYDLIIPV